jgi:hypothetical protein
VASYGHAYDLVRAHGEAGRHRGECGFDGVKGMRHRASSVRVIGIDASWSVWGGVALDVGGLWIQRNVFHGPPVLAVPVVVRSRCCRPRRQYEWAGFWVRMPANDVNMNVMRVDYYKGVNYDDSDIGVVEA